jgi:hypothetical protein
MSETYNLFDELIGLVEYLEEPEQWSTDESQQWADRCLVWIRQQIKLNEATLKATNQTGTENN